MTKFEKNQTKNLFKCKILKNIKINKTFLKKNNPNLIKTNFL